MKNEARKWIVVYDHKDGRSGKVEIETEITDSQAFQYGNGKCGCLRVGDISNSYDLRYSNGDLHKTMIKKHFGNGLIEIIEI